jgi:4-hydroxy-2-oxoglutarate aldolase
LTMLIDGIHIPLTAPFYRDGRSYLRKLEHNVGRYSLTPAAGMVALVSEGAALSDEEIRETLEVVGRNAAAEKVLIASIAKDSVRGALAIAEQAAANGFDAVLLSAPPLWQQLCGAGQSTEVMVFLRAVADASPLPVLLSSEVCAPGYGIAVEAVGELAVHPNIIGLYDADLTEARYRELTAATAHVQREVTVTTVFAPVTRRMQVTEPAVGSATFVTAESLAGGAAVAVAPPRAALKTRTKMVGFQVMAMGAASGIVELLEAGVAGAMPRLAACAPQGCYEAYAAWKDGNPALAREKEQRLAAADELMDGLGIAGIKYGCDWNGYYGGVPRLPRLALDGEARARVERVLAGIRN